ncbi:MAG: MBL fold metallo-hydrolase [Clostridium sp.]
MNFFKNVHFLSRLTYTNVREYLNERTPVSKHALTKNSIHWYGHATTVIDMDGKLILTDPVISNRLGFFKRVSHKPTEIQDTKFHYILLSHGHMDHMHFPSLRKFNKDAIVICPRGYKRILTLLGFKHVILLRPGQVFEDNYLKIKSIQAKHDGRRFYVGIDKESNSYLIERNGKKVFVAGDTAMTNRFNKVSCDVAVFPVGCYKPERFSYMHCSPTEAYTMFKNMNAKYMLPVHYKTFKISLEDFDETYSTLQSFKDNNVKILDIGETFEF